MEALGVSADFWRDRRVLVTGAPGLLGGWLVPALLAGGADVVTIVRDWVPESQLIASGRVADVTVVRGDVCDQALLERVLGEYEIATVLHLAAQAIVPIANRNPVSTFETNIAGTWRLLEACRRSGRSCSRRPTRHTVSPTSSRTSRRCHSTPSIPTTSARRVRI